MARPRIIAGIDVGSSKIAAIIASFDSDEEKVSVIGTASVDSRGVRKGQIVNIEEAAEAVVSAVEAAERMAGYSLTHAFISVDGAHISSQNSRGVVAVARPAEEITADDVRRVIEAARAVSLPSSREIIHAIPRYFTVDSQEGVKDPAGMAGVRLEVETHLVTGSTTSMRNLGKCVAEVGADIDSFVSAGLASAEAVLSPTEKELGVILVDIGGGTTHIAIFVEGSLAYSSVLPIGAKNVTNDLAIGLRVSLESAEKIKLALGEAEKKPTLPDQDQDRTKGEESREAKQDEEDEDEIDLKDLGIVEEVRTVSRKTLVEGIVRPRLNEIFTMVGLEVKKSGFGGMTPSGVVVSGGGAVSVGCVEAAKKMLSLPARVGTPKGVTGLVDEVGQPPFAALVGLVLYGVRQEQLAERKFSFESIERLASRLQVKGMAGKVADLVKSFLP